MTKTTSKKEAWCRSIALIPVFIAAICVFSTKTFALNEPSTLFTYESVENPIMDNELMMIPEKEQLSEIIVKNEVKRPSKQANGTVKTSVPNNDRTITPEKDFSKEQIPNVFIPNTGGKDSLFLEGYHLQVFNRLGTLFYEGTNGWDGTFKGEPMPEGAYYYIAKRTMNNEKQQIFRGSVLLKRSNSQP